MSNAIWRKLQESFCFLPFILSSNFYLLFHCNIMFNIIYYQKLFMNEILSVWQCRHLLKIRVFSFSGFSVKFAIRKNHCNPRTINDCDMKLGSEIWHNNCNTMTSKSCNNDVMTLIYEVIFDFQFLSDLGILMTVGVVSSSIAIVKKLLLWLKF